MKNLRNIGSGFVLGAISVATGLGLNQPAMAQTSDRAGGIEELSAGLPKTDFEDLLEHNYMGSYLFYKRLTAEQQQVVYEFYLQNPDPKEIRLHILRVKKSL